jgi:superfamily II DNA or RNA helicase
MSHSAGFAPALCRPGYGGTRRAARSGVVNPTQAPELHHGQLVRIRGERWRIDRCAGDDNVAIVDVVGCDATNRSERTRFLLPFEPVDRLEYSTSPLLVGRARWRHVARRTLADASPSWSSLRAATRANLTLIPFQLEPALALARGDGCRFLIADAVGLGKTVEAGLMIAETLERRPDANALVISPAGLREQWREELQNRFDLDATILDGPRLAAIATQLPTDVNPWAIQPIVITSIDYIKRPEVMRSLETLMWDVVVFDEAHHLTGRSDRAAAAEMLGDRARAVVLLTATPHSGEDRAFSRLCTVGNAGGSAPLVVFRRTRLDAGLHVRRRTPLLRVKPTPAETAMHAALMAYARLVWSQSAQSGLSGGRLAVSVLTRRGCSSAASLARSLERRLALMTGALEPTARQPGLPFTAGGHDDDEPDIALESPGLHDRAGECRVLERLLWLARAAEAAESKIAVIERLLSRVDEPAIVFTEYRDTLRRLAGVLSHIDAVQLHGGLTPHERSDALHRFTRGEARLLLATDAGSEGLNLHHRCRLVVNLELPWTPLRLEQRAGRVDRIGQQRRVHALHLVAAGTCEEDTLARLVLRINRMCGALNALVRAPDEQRVAESVLGGHNRPDLLDESSPGAGASGIATLDLREAAVQEARRIGQARAFSTGAINSHAFERPVVAHIRRRRMRAAPRCVWVYRVVLTTGAGRLLWESLLPLMSEATRATRYPPALLRTVLNPDVPALRAALADGSARLLEQLRQSMRPTLDRWSARERDLTAALQARHARLSAGLLQRRLFDRRDERLAATQASVLDEALSRSAKHLRDAGQFDDPRIDANELVFAMLLE